MSAQTAAVSEVGVDDKDALSMGQLMMPPPPPPPVILEAEINVLSQSLANIAIKMGHIYKFYSDARTIGISSYASHPPCLVTSSLADEIARYDQTCDLIEAHLLNSLGNLQKNLQIEEVKRRKETGVLYKMKCVAFEAISTPTSTSDDTGLTAAEQGGSDSVSNDNTAPGIVPITQVRRQSKISLSTLHRSPFPLKLDLSSSALRFSMDEVNKGLSGLGSPVTLAPKSARATAPNEIPPEILAALTAESEHSMEMELTMGTHTHNSGNMAPSFALNSNLVGSSSTKPVELDIDLETQMPNVDMISIFNDHAAAEVKRNTDIDSLFTPAASSPMHLPVESGSETTTVNLAILDTFPTDQGPGSSNNLFSNIESRLAADTDANAAQSSTVDLSDISNFDSEFFSNDDVHMDIMDSILSMDHSANETNEE